MSAVPGFSVHCFETESLFQHYIISMNLFVLLNRASLPPSFQKKSPSRCLSASNEQTIMLNSNETRYNFFHLFFRQVTGDNILTKAKRRDRQGATHADKERLQTRNVYI